MPPPPPFDKFKKEGMRLGNIIFLVSVNYLNVWRFNSSFVIPITLDTSKLKTAGCSTSDCFNELLSADLETLFTIQSDVLLTFTSLTDSTDLLKTVLSFMLETANGLEYAAYLVVSSIAVYAGIRRLGMAAFLTKSEYYSL